MLVKQRNAGLNDLILGTHNYPNYACIYTPQYKQSHYEYQLAK
jgi:hypothetical protein